jgi:hypothetical protein
MTLVGRHTLMFLLAAIGQLAVAIAPSADGWRGPDTSAHAEQRGTQLHHAHNEATCPGCFVQSLQACAQPPACPLPTGRERVAATVTRADDAPYAGEPSSHGSRAPPAPA